MADANTKTHPEGNAEKDPHDWVTGDEPMTGAQASYLKTLCEETDEEFNENLTKAEASEMIDRLRDKSPRLKHD
ncbi:DUF3072 domain-containing protein [Rubellimicrobium rubrum]|uniref:DUF3072 domain-containing protein n=1 Tax=Rubellimicrobium rubrum TaxID=2585369 RepID=A0A5C4MTM4_9RHOB|nr:DUF3072 domain-containing protein [Rubellimicrobium rubrum]TNC48316.1 DUF3072 domain-containing protein [Rubellimicrobium rubrum]